MAVTITSPQSAVVARGSFTLQWTNTFPQASYEILYRRKGESAWSTFGKVAGTATQVVVDCSKFEDFVEYQYRVICYSEYANTTETTYSGLDASAAYAVIITPPNMVGMMKVKYGDGMIEVPLYSTTQSGAQTIHAGDKMTKLIDTTGATSGSVSKLRVREDDMTKSAPQASKYLTDPGENSYRNMTARSTYYTTYTIPAYYKYVPAYYKYTAPQYPLVTPAYYKYTPAYYKYTANYKYYAIVYFQDCLRYFWYYYLPYNYDMDVYVQCPLGTLQWNTNGVYSPKFTPSGNNIYMICDGYIYRLYVTVVTHNEYDWLTESVKRSARASAYVFVPYNHNDYISYIENSWSGMSIFKYNDYNKWVIQCMRMYGFYYRSKFEIPKRIPVYYAYTPPQYVYTAAKYNTIPAYYAYTAAQYMYTAQKVYQPINYQYQTI